MSGVGSWTIYVRLRQRNGRRLIFGQVWRAFFVSGIVTFCWAAIGAPNSFAKDGLIDGLGSLSSLLAGFYVAGLVAIATFFRENSSLDDVISNGPVVLNYGTDNEEHFTRRQYVCSMFGFLVGISFSLAISSVLLRSGVVGGAELIKGSALNIRSHVINIHDLLEGGFVWIWLFAFVWQIEVTLRGIYYLMDRIYDIRPKLGRPPAKGSPDD